MAKTYVATSIGPNHDIDIQVDGQGGITGWVLKGEVNYGEMGRGEILDIWPLLTPDQRATLQGIYDWMRQAFNDHFIGP